MGRYNQLILTGGSAKLVVSIESRPDDNATWTSVATFADITSTGVVSKDATGLNQQVRLKFEFQNTTTATDGAHFFVMPPAWRPYA